MIEPECAFADLNDNMDLAEAMLKYVIRYVLENAPEEMNFFNSFVDKGLLDRLNHVINSEFGHVTYTEAVELLEKNNDKFDYKVFWDAICRQSMNVILQKKSLRNLYCNRLSEGDQSFLHEDE